MICQGVSCAGRWLAMAGAWVACDDSAWWLDTRDMLLHWEDRNVVVDDIEELDARLDEISAQSPDPVLVSLSSSSGTLRLGLGHADGGLLLFLPADGLTGPMHSLGDGDAGDGEVRFRRGETTVGFHPRCLISEEVMREAARSILIGGTL